jgi:hypothetical protein
METLYCKKGECHEGEYLHCNNECEAWFVCEYQTEQGQN